MEVSAYLHSHAVFLLILIIVFGFLLGRIRLFNFSLETSGILFVAMAFGHFGFRLPGEFQTLGLILFIYAIGLQAGPSIFNISRKQGFQLNLIVLVLISSGAVLTLILAKLLDVNTALAVGLFTGALTSTPGLAAAQEATGSTLTSTGYGLAYSFGVIGVILFIKLMPVIFRSSIKEEDQKITQEEQKQKRPILRKEVVITNQALEGKTLADLHFFQTTGTVISRISQKGKIVIPGPDTELHVGDVVRIIGEEAQIKAVIPFLGKESEQPLPDVSRFESRKFILTNRDIVGKTISELNLRQRFNANITRVRRGGLEFTAEPGLKLQWGDRVRVVGEADQMEQIRQLFGDEMRKIEYGDVFAITMGILIGVLIGLVPFSIGRIFSFSLGLTGGVLFAGLFLSNRGKVGPVIWQVPVPIITFMRDLGLTFFLAVVGTKAGAEVVQVVQTSGPKLILMGALITVLPMVLVSIWARKKYKLYLLDLMGIISGGMTSSPGLAAAASMTESQRPIILYATVYPFAMILMIIWAKIMALF
ncbi:aspartate:alanine exchanger family transporter [Calditrichota bacterium GD2]